MNLRPRGGAARRGRPAPRPVYEEFKPSYEWNHEDGASILLYNLPGFSKEQIRIIAESKGVLRVKGERLIANNKLSQFEEQVVVPEDCNMNEIRAKFEAGILKITMPKKMVTMVDKRRPSEEQPNTTFQRPPTPSVTRPNVQPKSRLQEEMPPKPTVPPSAQQPQFGTIVNPPRPTTPWKDERSEPQPERPQEATIMPPMTLPRIDNRLKQPIFNQDNVYDNRRETFVQDQNFHDENPANIVGYKGGESVRMPNSHARENEVKERYDDEASHGIQEKHEVYDDAIDQERESKYDLSKMKRVDHKQVMKSRLSKESLNEDRKLLVNMGAAILVIFALGTSIVYSFGSSE